MSRAEIGKRLGSGELEPVATAAKPDTILAWFRKLGAQKFDGSRDRLYPGRPPIGCEITELIVRLARENSGWGYDRIAGALQNLGHHVSNQTVLFFLHLETRRSFQNTLRSAGVQRLRPPARSPNLNAFAEHWVRSLKSECLSS